MSRPSLDGVRTHVILSKPQREQVEKLATRTGMTVSEHLRRAVDQYLANLHERRGYDTGAR